ncbi:glucosamine-6-phosphate deaminase [Planctomycetales bacterium ZRK34]|nr:glucosamine-6-phosphate deaminase [Planctomycetales bacterium ZRK34]
MEIHIFEDAPAMGRAAGEHGAKLIRRAIAERGGARIIVATGASQFDTLDTLTQADDIDWAKVDGFHLDEYLGLPMSHPASFRGYLKQRVVDKVPLRSFTYINGEAHDPQAECKRIGKLLNEGPIDVAMVGIGENGHLAFNDPPADFETERPYLVVDLDEACRRQQHGEGWFESLEAVPRQAISMSIRQIMKSKAIICSVPDQRKAEAVERCLYGPVSPEAPASILQNHPSVAVYLDRAAAGH